MANEYTWPSSLPRPLLKSAENQIDFGYVNSPMDSGLMIQRVEYATPVATMTASVILDKLGRDRMYAFLRALRGSSFDFQASLPGDPDNDLKTVSARFTGRLSSAPTVSAFQKEYSLDLFIEKVEELRDNDDDLWVYYDWADGNFDVVSQLLENAVNAGP